MLGTALEVNCEILERHLGDYLEKKVNIILFQKLLDAITRYYKKSK
jgi:hypothetical protein